MRVLVVLAALAGVAHADATIRRTACPLPAPAQVECFTLTVPANRTKPSPSTIAIPIVRFRSRSPHPLEPIVFLAGGPGVNAINHLDRQNSPFLADHDYILFQQRGGKFSSPELACPEWTGDAAKHRAEAAACGKRLVASGVDLDGFDTAEIVADLFDLQRALAIPTMDLFGVSYGTRVALEALRAQPSPHAIHAVILDSVLPPDVRYDELATDNALAALDRVLDQCAVDPTCARAYPDLRARWTAALARSKRPRDLMEAVYDELNDRSHIAGIPKLVDEIARGELAHMAKIVADNAGPSSAMRGERLSVWCRDEAPITHPERASKHPELGGWQTVAFPPDVCRAWPVSPSSPSTNPVTSDVPVLIFAGEFDPNTPPAWGRRALATLPNGNFVELAGETHVAADGPCAISLVLAFLRDPRHLPDATCAARFPLVHFE